MTEIRERMNRNAKATGSPEKGRSPGASPNRERPVQESTPMESELPKADQQERTAFVLAALAQHEKRLTLYARSLLGDLDRARDVVQETFLRLCRAESEVIEGHLTEWLFRVCRNLAHDVQRKDSRMGTPGQEQIVASAGSVPATSDESDTRDEAGHALQLIEKLPEKQCEVLKLKFQQGLSYKEISHVAEVSIGHVGWLIHMGMKTLRAQLVIDGTEGAQA
ncbi:MAG: RNA polymerase sigma factor (sigma-70 family) [Planctomycetota bacterium]|jgi:RNA polymerase sigma factor (sigma-70 family)